MSIFRLGNLPLTYTGLLAGLVLSLTFVASLRNYYNHAYDDFFEQGDVIREQVAKRIGKLEQITHDLSRYRPDPAKTSVAFSHRVQQVKKEYGEIDYIAYAQRVEQSGREAYEQLVRKTSYPNYTIIEQGLNEYQAARIREQYFSILDIEPLNEEAEQVLGLDLYASAAYRNAILKSLQSGDLVVVQPLNIFRMSAPGFVFVDLDRHFDQENTIKTNPWSGVRGAVILKVNIIEMLASIKIPDNWHLSYNEIRHEDSGFEVFPQRLIYEFTPQLSKYNNRIFITLTTPVNFNQFVTASILSTLAIAMLVFVMIMALLRFVINHNDYLLENNLKVQALVDTKTKELEDEKVRLHQEIEERHRLEKQAIYFGRILDQTSNEIYMFTLDTYKFVKVNQGALKNLGYTMEEMLLMAPYDIKPEYDKRRFELEMQPLLEGRQNRLVFETRHQRKDGTCYPVEVRLQIVQGDQAVFVAVIEDISERYNTSDKMRKLSSALEASRDIVFITDKRGVIEYVNPAFESSTGYRAADAIGRRPNLLNSFKQDSSYYKKLWSTISSGEHFQGVIINRKKSGELYYEEKTITPIFNDDGVICNYVSTGRDITEREMARQQMQEKNKQLEMEIIERESVQAELRKHRAHLSELVDQRTIELAKARDEAVEANSAKTRFLMNMSHELRTPLNAIIGYSELLKEELQESSNSEFIEDVEKIALSGNHLLGLINELLDLSRVEVGKLELESAEFSLMDLLKSVEYAVQPLMAKNQNRFVIEKEYESGNMIGDVKRVRQVLVNLVANAGKFTQNGEVRLHTSVFHQRRQDWIEFKISDTGIGIAPDKMNRLFQEFSQADENIGIKYGGTGLGLAISKKLCESMGGQIEVKSEIDCGSVFTVILPYTTEVESGQTLKKSISGI